MTEPRSEATPDSPPDADVPRCPWCSAELKNNPARCPSCGAMLHEDAAAEIPGVTALDPAASTVARPTPRSRGLLGWLSGEYESAEAPTERSSVEPPSDAVRVEMARLEMAALQAEVEAAEAEEAAERAGYPEVAADASEPSASGPGAPA
jgi:hypothetical protein